MQQARRARLLRCGPVIERGKRGFERWAFLAAALLIAAAAVIGFTPSSIAILTGRAENPPLIIHAHAAVMSAWIALLVVQAALIARGRAAVHQRLGMVAVILAPVIVALMISIAIGYYPGGEIGPAVVATQLRRIVLFSLFITCALLVRRSNPGSHKRLMILASVSVIDAAFFRMGWFLPSLGIDSMVVAAHVQQLVLLVPILALDFKSYGRPHPATVIGLVVLLGFTIAIGVLWPD